VGRLMQALLSVYTLQGVYKMPMKLEDVAQYVADMQEQLQEKLPEDSSVDLEVRLNYSAFSKMRFYCYMNPRPENFPPEKSFDNESELFEYLSEVALHIHNMPSQERQAQLLAGRELGKAIDKAREVGLDIDGIAVSFQGLWENLIEDKSKG
jgi:hypothetical protein